MDPAVLRQLGIAVGLGLLVGFQREWRSPHVAGLRTFAMIPVFGVLCAQLAGAHGGWMLAAGLLAVTAIIVVAWVVKVRAGEIEPGLTTEIAALVLYGVGAMLAGGHTAAALTVGGGVAVLLHWKEPLHKVVQRIGELDIRAILTLALIAMVILPVLPNRTFGPYDVLNPFHIWMMVVLIVGISVGSYVAFKFLGARAGTLLGGLLGGLISSTATTVSQSRRSRAAPGSAAMAALVILIASTIAFARIALEIAVVAPKVLVKMLPPLAVMVTLMAGMSVALLIFTRGKAQKLQVEEDPSQLRAAILFALLYAGVLFAVAAVKEHFGDSGLYAVAGISGLTDVDAITLSTTQLVKTGRLPIDTGWRMILLAGLSNIVFKGLAVAVLGDRRLLKRIAVVFGIALVGGALLLVLWPTIA